MLKISLRFYLLASILTLISVCILHDQFTLSMGRFISAVYFCSFFSLPGILILNALLRVIKSLRLNLFCSWVLLLTSILTTSHLVLSVLVVFEGVNMGTVALIWLVVNSSAFLALLMQFFAISHLFKSVGYGKESSITVG